MNIQTIIEAFARMMRRKLQLAGREPGAFEGLEWTHIHTQALQHQSNPVMRQMLSAWSLQLDRERGNIHLSQEAMLAHWHAAIVAGEAFVDHLLAKEDAEKAAVLAQAAKTPARAIEWQAKPDAVKAVKRRFMAYAEGLQALAAGASHAQVLTALSRKEGFTNFQALKAQLDKDTPAFCLHCGTAGSLKEVASRQFSCMRCAGSFSLMAAHSAPQQE